MKLDFDLETVDAALLFFLQFKQIYFTRTAVTPAYLQYQLSVPTWGSVGSIVIRKLTPDCCDIHWPYPPLPTGPQVFAFIEAARMQVRRQFLAEEQAKDPNAPLERLIRESDGPANLALTMLYPDFEVTKPDDSTFVPDAGQEEIELQLAQIGLQALRDYIYKKRSAYKSAIMAEFYQGFSQEHNLHTSKETAEKQIDAEIGKANRQPRVPKQSKIRARWVAAWRYVKHMYYEGKSYREMSVALRKIKRIQMSADVLADVIRAGEAGLLDSRPDNSQKFP